MRYVGPVAVIKLHNIVDDLDGIIVSKTIRLLSWLGLLTELEKFGPRSCSRSDNAIVIGAKDDTKLSALCIVPVAPDK